MNITAEYIPHWEYMSPEQYQEWQDRRAVNKILMDLVFPALEEQEQRRASN